MTAEPATVRESPALRPPPGHPRSPLVDSLRGVAILLVVVFHAAGTAGASTTGAAGAIARQGFVGVMIFFAISGFLIYRPFAAARDGGRRAPSLRRYWRRRALRIFPAYWVALTAFAAVGAISDVATVRAPVYYLFGQIYAAKTFSNGIPVAWSLGVEMSFYLLLPVYAWLVSRAGRRWPVLEGAGIVLLVAVSLVERGFVRAGRIPDNWASTLPGMATFFAVGMAFAAVSVRLEGREDGPGVTRVVRRYADLLWLGAIAAYVVAATTFKVVATSTVNRSWASWYGNYLLCATVAALALAPAVFGQEGGGIARRVLRNPLLAWIGLVSYGIFLWHLPLMIKLHGRIGDSPLVLFAGSMLIATAVAAASYYALELPLLRLKEPRRRSS